MLTYGTSDGPAGLLKISQHLLEDPDSPLGSTHTTKTSFQRPRVIYEAEHIGITVLYVSLLLLISNGFVICL